MLVVSDSHRLKDLRHLQKNKMRSLKNNPCYMLRLDYGSICRPVSLAAWLSAWGTIPLERLGVDPVFHMIFTRPWLYTDDPILETAIAECYMSIAPTALPSCALHARLLRRPLLVYTCCAAALAHFMHAHCAAGLAHSMHAVHA